MADDLHRGEHLPLAQFFQYSISGDTYLMVGFRDQKIGHPIYAGRDGEISPASVAIFPGHQAGVFSDTHDEQTVRTIGQKIRLWGCLDMEMICPHENRLPPSEALPAAFLNRVFPGEERDQLGDPILVHMQHSRVMSSTTGILESRLSDEIERVSSCEIRLLVRSENADFY